jgi:hypothetical protein
MALIGGFMPARKALPDDDHVMRFASRSKRVVDSEGKCFGPSPAAFAIRTTDEGGLSVTWVEYFGTLNEASRASAAAAYRQTLRDKRLPSEAIFAWAQVSVIKRAGAEYRKGLRVVHDPVDGNPAHAEIRHFNDEDLDLLEYMASDVFRDYVVVRDMNIPAPGASD